MWAGEEEGGGDEGGDEGQEEGAGGYPQRVQRAGDGARRHGLGRRGRRRETDATGEDQEPRCGSRSGFLDPWREHPVPIEVNTDKMHKSIFFLSRIGLHTTPLFRGCQGRATEKTPY